MKIKLHENGWTAIVEDLDLKQATQKQMNTIAWLIANQTVVVLRGQSLTLSDQEAVCEKIGEVENFGKQRTPGTTSSLLANGSDKVIRVTGELDEHGKPGLFGHVSDLDWHANQAANEWRHPVVWLYGVKGTEGSRTSWINNILSYNDLSDQEKESLKNIKMINGYKQGAYSESVFGKPVDINYSYKPNIVHTNNAGKTGLFFPFLQIHEIDGMNAEQSLEFITKLRDHILQEKYMYHHSWQDGDVVIAEQWLGIHKRWYFEKMDQRLLHRIAFGFDNCDFNDIEKIDF